MPSKRKNPPTSHSRTLQKRRTQRDSESPYAEPRISITGQAANYLLATAKFPIDQLTADWAIGQNRPINKAHKKRIHQLYNEVGVLRRDSSHRLQVTCTKAQVDKMRNWLAENPAAENIQDNVPSFMDWAAAGCQPAELMAGNHRVQALQDFLEETGRNSPEERYKQFQQNICSFLGMGTQMKDFPVRRLATLWWNKRWKVVITEWYSWPIGRDTFNLSKFEWRARSRIDDFWFNTFI
ncbi:hypothetical protein CC80DRAFT_509011 [Byssothecium circinans]|uniref:Uncharacterized protein n=1 Tax=Byssothecium circinans TaxID=147558 RepID=A0A6A5TG64_9PLEO|nr:hypothetical protein CC80DRAFT_509011 [Byssothecium circinans]